MNLPTCHKLGVAGCISILLAVGSLGYVFSMTPARGRCELTTAGKLIAVLAQGFAGEGRAVLASKGGVYGSIVPKELVIPWARPTTPAPPWLEVQDQPNAKEEHIQNTLNERMEVDFDGLSLSTIVKIIRSKFKIPIFLDTKGLLDAKIDADDPITLRQPATKLGDVLKQLLSPLGLAYQVHCESIVITTKSQSANVVRFYDLSYILPDNGLVSELIYSIELMVTPDEWQSAGGTSSIATIGSMMVIRAQPESHDAIARLLRAISKQSPANMKRRVVADAPEIE